MRKCHNRSYHPSVCVVTASPASTKVRNPEASLFLPYPYWEHGKWWATGWVTLLLIIFLASWSLSRPSLVWGAQSGDDFDLSKHSVPLEQIMSGGPRKDGIPAIVEPKFVAASKVTFLSPGDMVISVVSGGEAKAYPLRVLNWHEVVNDEIAGKPVAVTYCPLTGSGVVYERKLGKEAVSFGVSGRLYESNLLLYDRKSESLWSQLKYEAVAGPMTGAHLRPVPSRVTSWDHWRKAHPQGSVLSLETGYERDYSRNPYASYEQSDSLMFPVVPQDRRMLPKDKVLGVVLDGKAVAYPLATLARLGGEARHSVASHTVSVKYDRASSETEVVVDGKPAFGVLAYWFAWYAFHPDTEIWGRRPLETGLGADRVVVKEKKGSWSSLLGIMGGVLHRADSDIYLITGELENVSGKDVAYTRLVYELLDAQGSVLFREYGYNREAERLRDPDFELGEKPASALGVPPIKSGGKDRFRMIFFTDEIPRFDHYRIRIAEAPFSKTASSKP